MDAALALVASITLVTLLWDVRTSQRSGAWHDTREARSWERVWPST